MTMFEDRSGLVWIGTYGGGVNVYDPNEASFTHYLPNADDVNSISSDRVTSFAEDTNGNLWVGTDGGGLNVFDRKNGQFSQFRHDPNDVESLASDTVYSINIDANGDVWVGTQGGGLDRVIGDANKPQSIKFANVSEKDG